MPAALPSDTRIERTEGGFRLTLPKRPLGSGRMMGLFFIPFGAVFAGGPLTGAISTLQDGCFGLIFVVFTIPFIVVGLGIIALGLWFLFPARTRIVLDLTHLRTTERFGPFWWTRSVPRDKVRSFHVSRTSAAPASGGPIGSLQVEVEGRTSSFVIGQSYPVDWLEGVAQALGETHGAAPVGPTVDPPPPVPTVPRVVETHRQPDGSNIVLEYAGDVVRLRVPKKGIKGNGCLIGFGVIWSGISSIVFGAAIASGEWGGAAFASLFVGVGAAVILGAIHGGIKTLEIELSRAALVVRKKGIFGRKVEEWPRGSIREISVEDSGWEVNDVRQWQLRVERADAKPLKLLRGRSTDELHWICSVLKEGPMGRMETAPQEVKVSGAECQVCNAPMTADIVYCARCKTPHHGQCWQYLGQCSTYGCREIRYTTT